MSRTTKPELERQLIASQRDNAALREQISVLRAQLEATQLREVEMANALEHAAGLPRCTWVNTTHTEFMALTRKAAAPAETKTTTVDLPTAPRAKRELPAHFAAAREAAMRLGRVVRVDA